MRRSWQSWEVQADFLQGTFIAAVQKDTLGIPLVKMPDSSEDRHCLPISLNFRNSTGGTEGQCRGTGWENYRMMAKEAKGVVLKSAGGEPFPDGDKEPAQAQDGGGSCEQSAGGDGITDKSSR